jgi:hypothetical protein
MSLSTSRKFPYRQGIQAPEGTAGVKSNRLNAGVPVHLGVITRLGRSEFYGS